MALQELRNMKPSSMSSQRAVSHSERRNSRRCKITQLMLIRPSDPEKENFEDIRGSLSVSRGGAYFHTTEENYEVGMRLFVTMPFTKDPTALNREYLAEVVRMESLTNGLTGVGLKLLMEMGLQQNFSFSSPLPRR
jgi:PilZ domain